MEERLQKIMARAGFGSRRSCEELIRQKRVAVNGKVAGLGDQANPQKDKITVDGRLLPKAEPFKYIALHKPRKVLSDDDPKDDRQTVFDLVPVEGHLFSVGRLDYNSEGLILLTNDGELANKLTHPRYGHEKEYRVLVASHPDAKQLGGWRRGVVMEDGTRTLPAIVQIDRAQGKGIWLRVILREGRKRQIREVCTRIGLSVVTILRVRINTLELGNLKPRQWRHLSESEVEMLRKAPSTKPPRRPAAARRVNHRRPQPTAGKKRPARRKRD
jgi:23S rRNA pseudouridine2605 synthase